MFPRTRSPAGLEVTSIDAIAVYPRNGCRDPEPDILPTPKEPRDPLKLARYYHSLLHSRNFHSRAALARYFGVRRARVIQVPDRLNSTGPPDGLHYGLVP